MSDAKSEPTPRPWIYDATLPQFVYSNDATGSLIARCGGKGFEFVHRTNAECEANAQFIVRAVNAHDALLEALKAARDYLYDVGRDTDMAPTMDKIEVAINLAEGL
jgi:hypothetical protein